MKGRIIEAKAHIVLPEQDYARFLMAIGLLKPIAGGANDFTDYLEKDAIDHYFRNQSAATVATAYADLFTATPGETGGGTEVSGNGYARQAAGFAVGSQVGNLYTVANAADVVYPADVTANWGTITHFGISDASSGGNLLAFAALASSKTVTVGDVFKFLAGALTVALG